MQPLDPKVKKALLNALRDRIYDAINRSVTGIVIFQLNDAEILLKDELLSFMQVMLYMDDISYQDFSTEETPGVLRIDGTAFKNAKPSSNVNMVNVKNVVLPGARVSAAGNVHIGDTKDNDRLKTVVVSNAYHAIMEKYIEARKVGLRSFNYNPTYREKEYKDDILDVLRTKDPSFNIAVLGSDTEPDPREGGQYWSISYYLP